MMAHFYHWASLGYHLEFNGLFLTPTTQGPQLIFSGALRFQAEYLKSMKMIGAYEILDMSDFLKHYWKAV